MSHSVDGVGTPPVIRLVEDRLWDRTADVVVIGTGVGGCSTAVNCAHLGASVIMLEKGATTGGTSAKSAAAAIVPNNRFLRALGRGETKEDFMKFLARIGRPLLYDPQHPSYGLPQWEYDLIEVYFDYADKAWSHMEDIGAACVMHSPDWPSAFDVPEDKLVVGRVIFPATEDGEMTDGRTAVDRMVAKAVDLGSELMTGFSVNGLYVNQAGEIVGVRGEQAGVEKAIRANKAVVFASGGFTHNKQYVAEYLNGQIAGGCAAITNTGDLVGMAKGLGIPLYGMQSLWTVVLVYEQALDKDPDLISNFYFQGDSVFTVNKYGKRVGNEKLPYSDRTQSHLTWNPTLAEYSNYLQFTVMDRRCRERFASSTLMDHGAGNFIPAIDEMPDYFLEGATLEELAEKFSERLAARASHHGGVKLADDFVANLRDSIQRFNTFARQGKDEDFHRGERWIERNILKMADDNDLPNPTMYPLSDTGPYYGTIMAPGAIETKGGPRVNARMQMLDGMDQPVPGLYGVGNCVASPSGQAYWSSGSTWGPYLTFGYVAAHNIVQEPAKTIGAAPMVQTV